MNLNEEDVKLVDELLQNISSDSSYKFRAVESEYSSIEYAQIKLCAQYIKDNELARVDFFECPTSVNIRFLSDKGALFLNRGGATTIFREQSEKEKLALDIQTLTKENLELTNTNQKFEKELRIYKVTSLILTIIVALITVLQFFKK